MPDGHAAVATQPDHGPDTGAGLPTWDLSDLFPSSNGPEIELELTAADAAARTFAKSVAGTLATATASAMAAALAGYERLEERLGRIVSYGQLLFSADSSDPETGKLYQTLNERVTAISSHLIFFTLELNRIDDPVMAAKLADPAMARWRPFMRDLLVFRPHQLGDELERLLHEKDVSGSAAWSRLFDETVAGMTVPVRGEELTVSAALNKLSDADRDVREAAGHAIGEVFGRNIKLFSLITNTLAKDKETVDTWRHYPRPESSRNRGNMVEDEVVDALVSAVTSDYGRLSHRYYGLKAKWLGLETLRHWDRNAPLPGDDDRKIGWDEARNTVLGAYGAFSPDLAQVAQPFFDHAWIDAPPRVGKSGGAFAHPTVPSAHPYLLLNYHGRTRDVMTLAHELGHGVHQRLAAGQGYLQSGTPLTLAETASVFGEMLTFRALLDGETSPARRKIMLAGKVEDMLNTVVRQVAFYQFEQRVHAERRTGELVPERINQIWLDVQTASLGPAFTFDDEYRVFWSYVPHFIHSPFYVYAYAFGDCLVNALYGVFQSGHPGFQAKYLDLLRAGGTKRHKELLAPFGLDAGDPAFWRKGLDVISGFIDELERA